MLPAIGAERGQPTSEEFWEKSGSGTKSQRTLLGRERIDETRIKVVHME
jgi:hypothetical protein